VPAFIIDKQFGLIYIRQMVLEGDHQYEEQGSLSTTNFQRYFCDLLQYRSTLLLSECEGIG
jgi:hypothetical protein